MIAVVLIAVLATALAAAVLASLAIRSSGKHYRDRLADKAGELDRAYRRIDVLEQMLDESRATALNVTVPVKNDAKPARVILPDEVIEELSQIEDEGDRAELEADIRVQLEADPSADPYTVARKVLGGA